MLCWKKETLVGGAHCSAALWIITGVAPGAACSRSSSPQRGHRKAAQCTSQPALHKIQQKAPIEWTVENILQYDTEQYNLSDVSIREHFLCSSRKTAAICPSFYLYFTVLVSSSMRGISVQFGLTNWISRHIALWVFLYLYYHVVVWLCIQAHVNFQFFALQSGTVLDEFVVLCHPVFVSFVFLY